MPRIYLPLLPIPVLALVVAFSACSRSRTDEPTTHLIPPAVLAPAVGTGGALAAAPPPAVPDDPPSAEEMREFERPVAK